MCVCEERKRRVCSVSHRNHFPRACHLKSAGTLGKSTPSVLPVLFSLAFYFLLLASVSISLSVVLPSGHLSILIPFMGKGFGWEFLLFFESPAVECTVSREGSTFAEKWCSMEQWVPLSCPGLYFPVYIHQINAEIKMTSGSSSVPLGIQFEYKRLCLSSAIRANTIHTV